MLVVRDPAVLRALAEDLAGLARNALEPNPFHEPMLMIAAAEAFARREPVEFLLVHAPDPARDGRARLVGFFPVERVSRHRGIPLSTIRLWKHPHSFLGTPLIDAGFAQQALGAFLDHVVASGAPLLELRDVAADGAFRQRLADELRARDLAWTELDFAPRAVFRPAESHDRFLEAALSGRHRKDFRRRARKLNATFDRLATGEDPDAWLQEFLALEASGWKGREGTALGSTDAGRRFFLDAGRAAHAEGRLRMTALRQGPRAVAMKCIYLTPPPLKAGFAFKIAFDENFSRESPGVLLELEDLPHLHAEGFVWIDSCADAGHPMIDRLWSARRLIATYLVGVGRIGGLAVSALPLARFVARSFRKRATPVAVSPATGEEE